MAFWNGQNEARACVAHMTKFTLSTLRVPYMSVT